MNKQVIGLTNLIQLILEIVIVPDDHTIYLYANHSFYCRPQVINTIILERMQLPLQINIKELKNGQACSLYTRIMTTLNE